MMSNLLSTYVDVAQLALASYSNFRGLYSDQNVKSTLQFRGSVGVNSPDFSSTAAQNFIDRFEVVNQFTDPALLLNGFSATVFRNKESGQICFITRGTENSGDFLADGTLAIGVTARSQIISMVNYFLRLQAGAGNVARQIKASSILPSDGVAWDQSKTVLGVGPGLGVAQLVIGGHSLGGYLATIFGRVFNGNVAAAYTFNAPGAYGGFGLLDNISRLLGSVPQGFLDASRQTNVVGDYIVSSVPGHRGRDVRVFEESNAHSQKAVVDALALYSVFGELYPNAKAEEIRAILRAGSEKDPDSLESSLDSLRKIFLGPSIADTKLRGTEDTDATREVFYQNVAALRGSAAFKSASGQVSLVSLAAGSATEFLSLAQSDVAYRYALKKLNPFAITGAPELYDQYNGNDALALCDPSTGEGGLTNEWLQDRAQFLTWKNQKNINDVADDVSIQRKDNGVESYLFTDKTLKDAQGKDYSIRVVGGSDLQKIHPIRISFASDGGDTLQGDNYADHLYGGQGADTLAGGDGGDYLEGGAGDDVLGGDGGDDALFGGSGADTLNGGADDDILRGGSGTDTLIGGVGDDTLQGGKGNDILQGGAGDDVYVIKAGDGQDTLLDHEGENTAIYEDVSGKRLVLGGKGFAVAGDANSWNVSLTTGETVSFTRNSPLTATLPDGAKIIIDGFQDGDFGIHLLDEPADPAATRLIRGDWVPAPPGYLDDLFNYAGGPGLPGYGGSDRLWGSNGNDLITAGAGDDIVLARSGDDWITATGLNDYLDGGDGDDVIEAHGDIEDMGDTFVHETLIGGKGNDRLYAIEEIELTQDAIVGADVDYGYAVPGARVSGGEGDDTLVGSEYTDLLLGGVGRDVLVGLGGTDYIVADYMFDPDGTVPEDQPLQWPPHLPIIMITASAFDLAEGDDDIIFGGTDNDQIWANGGDDWISGGDADDVIIGGPGSDILYGGAGIDVLYADALSGASSPNDHDVLDGGDGDDVLIGGKGDDLLFGGAGDDRINGRAGDNVAYGGDGNDQINVDGPGNNEISADSPGNNEFYGEAGNDILRGGGGKDYLDGGEGDDILWGGAGADILAGGPGNDTLIAYQDNTLEGGEGEDVYKFRLGAGRNTIVDGAGRNQIVLESMEIPDEAQAPILRESIRLSLEGDQYRIDFGNPGDSFVLGVAELATLQGFNLRHLKGYACTDDYFDESTGEYVDGSMIEIFEDEIVTFTANDLHQLGSAEDDVLIGKLAFRNELDGQSGNDTLIGGSGNDTLTGGVGNDTLDGGDGADRYIINAGHGIDVISDSGTEGSDVISDSGTESIDTLVFGPGISVDALSPDAGSLLIRIGASGDAVYIDGFDPENAAAAGSVETFKFADDTELSHAQLVSRGFDLYGADSEDAMYGTNLVDRFHESPGDDVMVGGAGNDVYYFGVGSGHDQIVDVDTTSNNSDTVVLGGGILPGDLAVISSAGMLTLAVAEGNDRLDIQWQPQDGYAIERVQFVDGTIWDQATLESLAVPATEPDAGATTDEGGGAPPAESGTSDAGAGGATSGDATQTGSGGTQSADAGTPDAGAGTSTGGDTTQAANDTAPPADAGATDSATAAQAGGDATQTGSGGTQSADAGAPDAGAGTPADGDTTQAANGDAPPADAGATDSGAAAQAGGDATQTGDGGTQSADAGTPGAGAGTPMDGDTTQTANGGGPFANTGTAAAEAPPGGDTIQIGRAATPAADGGTTDSGAGTQVSGETIQIATGKTYTANNGTIDAGGGAPPGDETNPIGTGGTPPTANAGTSDAGAGTQVDGDTIQIGKGGTMPADAGTSDAGAGTQVGGNTIQFGNDGTLPADAGTSDAGAGSPSGGDTTQLANGATPSGTTKTSHVALEAPADDGAIQSENTTAYLADGTISAAEPGTTLEDGALLNASADGVAADNPESNAVGQASVAGASTTVLPKSQTAANPSQPDALAAEKFLLSAIDAVSTPAPLLNAAKPTDSFGAQFDGVQAAIAPSPTSYFTALQQPAQPNLQAWLDNWLGPRGRSGATPTSRNESQSLNEDDRWQAITPDTDWSGMPSDNPDEQATELLTPAQISQRDQDIEAWLDANPGFEQGIAGGAGALTEANPFAFFGAGAARNTGFMSAPGFGQTLGMATIAGDALKPLRGIGEGYTPLGLM